MKKINVTLYLTTLFFLIIFIGFTEARAGGPEHSKQDKRGSNQIELARQEREVQRKKNILMKKWRELEPGMTEKQLQNFLGRPKLIQSNSDESVWFYQDVPVLVSDVKEVKYGIVVFEAKSIRDLIEEEKARFDKIIARAVAKDRREVQIEAGRHYSSPDPIADLGPYIDRLKQTGARRDASIRKIREKYNGRVARLMDNRKPRHPVFAMKWFKQPDWNRFEELLEDRKPFELKSKGTEDGWIQPGRWRKLLMINMIVEKAHTVLGNPTKSERSDGGLVEYYGDISGYGKLHFTPRSDLRDHLDWWIEPFWPEVESQLSSLNTPTGLPAVGQEFRLSKETPLMPELAPEDPNVASKLKQTTTKVVPAKAKDTKKTKNKKFNVAIGNEEITEVRKPARWSLKRINLNKTGKGPPIFQKGIDEKYIRIGPGMKYENDDTGLLLEDEKLYVLEEKGGWIRFRITEKDLGWSAWIRKNLTDSFSLSPEKERAKRIAKFGEPPQNSAWDGSVRCVKDYLKAVAKDPDSLRYENWSKPYYSEDGWLVKCDYRAKNSFGGYVREVKWFVIRHGIVVDVKDLDTYKISP